MLTTAEIEGLYRKSSANTTFDAIKDLATREGMEVEASSVEESDNFFLKGDGKVLFVNGTRLFFVNNKYVGSKANLPGNLSHWWLGREEF